MDSENNDFEVFMRQFHLRALRPLPETTARRSILSRTLVAAAAATVIVIVVIATRQQESRDEQSASSPAMKPAPPAQGITRTRSIPIQFEVASIKSSGPARPNRAREPRAGFGCRGVDGVVPRVNAATAPQGRCIGRRASLFQLIFAANFDISPKTVRAFGWISGGPDWIDSDTFDIEAKAENTDSATREDLKKMLQALLADRFKLKFHREIRQASGYALVVANNGPKIDSTSDDEAGPFMRSDLNPGELTIRGVSSIKRLAEDALMKIVDAPVVDKTQLTGRFKYTLRIDNEPLPSLPTRVKGQDGEPNPSIFRALQEQLGLRLEAQRVPIEVIVIDQAEKPSEN